MSNGDSSSGSLTDDLTWQLQRAKEIEGSLKRLEGLLDVAERCDLNANDELKEVLNGYKLAYEAFHSKNLNKAYSDQFDAYHSLIKVLNGSRKGNSNGFRLWSLKYVSFMVRTYGLVALSYSIFAAIIFSVLLVWFRDQPPNLYGVPIWAVLFAGLGCSIQIIMGVVADVRANGILSEYKHLMYMALPFVALIFGYLAYILIDLGLVTLGGGQGGQSESITAANISLIKASGVSTFSLTHNEIGNYSFTAGKVANLAATGVDSFTSNLGIKARIIACFLAGYATDNFIKKLTNLTDKM
jgi:hypothetical protein